MSTWTRGYLSGFPEATTRELDRYFHHFHGGSPGATPPHWRDCPEGEECEFGPFMDVDEAVAAFSAKAEAEPSGKEAGS